MAAISEALKTSKPLWVRPAARAAICAALVFLALSVAAPFVNAARFSASIQQALQESLGRRVTFEKVFYRMLPVPGFSLENVTIAEDPRYGLEPFSYMNGLEARLRVDKLLLGQVRFASLRLVDPSLNIVKRGDGAWNIVAFVERMSAPRRMPLNLVPAIQVSNARLDFKLGTRKTVFYVTGADISIYPERSGRVAMNFKGSPARTDRAGNGFGSLRGNLNWSVSPVPTQSNQLEADVILEPSNLSELTTLIQGQDIGVHGTISSQAHVAGFLQALKVTGEFRLKDVHRWDLLPSSGADWRVPYEGAIDLLARRLDLRTLPPRSGEVAPAALQVKVNDFLAKPSWTLMTSLNKAPVESIMPLARRMGFALPQDVVLQGTMDGVVGYSNTAGLSGAVSIHDAVAKLPNVPPISAAGADLKVLRDSLHLEPSVLQATGGGTLRVGGDYQWAGQKLGATISVNDVAIETLKSTAQAWFGAPAAMETLTDGLATGELKYDGAGEAAGWSGQLQFSNATVVAPGIGEPLKHSQGRLLFTPGTLDLPHFSAVLGSQSIHGNYRYNQNAKRQEHIHLELPSADWEQIADALEPAWRDPGLLARLPFTKRSIPAWMSGRNLEGDVVIQQLMLSHNRLGPLAARFVWQGEKFQIAGLQMRVSDTAIKGAGTIDLGGRSPRARFQGALSGYKWAGGTINAEGALESSGAGQETLRSLHATGTFSGADLNLSSTDSFEKLSGSFELSLADGWPKLHLFKLQAIHSNDDWSGEALSNSGGQLVFDLGNGDRQLHIVSTLSPVPPPISPAALGGEKIAQK